jgi:hypothetical protein
MQTKRTSGRHISRRRLLGGLGGGLLTAALTGVLPAGRVLASHEDDASRDDRSPQRQPGYAGLARLRALALEGCQFTSLPGPDWPTYVHSWLNPVFNYPPTWTVDEIALHPSDGSSYGGAWVIAPDRSGQILTSTWVTYDTIMADDAAISLLQELASGADISLIFDDRLEQGNMSGAFFAGEFNGLIAAVHVASSLNPTANGSAVTYGVAVGVADLFDDTTEQVFEPFFNQFLCGGPGPGPIEDPDDDDDENGGED